MIEVLTRLVSERGAPRFLCSDNGSEFVSQAVLDWIAKSAIDTARIDRGNPRQDADNESLNGKFPDECLSLEWLRSRQEARVVIESRHRRHHQVRPHPSLKDPKPIEFKTRHV